MKRKRLLIWLGALALALGVFNSCSKDDSSGKAKFNVRLTDAPADYAEVNIDIQAVQIHISGSTDEKGWTDLSLIKKGVYNLLDFVNGKDTLLASDELAAGKISQIRLILGDNNSLKLKDGTVISGLKVPSGQESGLKLIINADLQEGVAYTLTLDFDAAKSIVEKGNKTYSLKPTIKGFLTATSGSITGTVLPVAAHPNIQAILNTDTFTTYPDTTGKFVLRGLPAGTYKLNFLPVDGFQSFTKENVSVSIGNATNLEIITLTK